MASTSPITLDDVAKKLDVLLTLTTLIGQRFFSVEQAARYSSISEKSIRRMLSSGELTALRPVPGRIVIDRRELDSVILAADHRPRTGRGLTHQKK